MVSLEQKLEAVLWLFATSDESEFSKAWCEANDITTALAIAHKLGYITDFTDEGEAVIENSLDNAVKSIGLDNLDGLLELIENAKLESEDI